MGVFIDRLLGFKDKPADGSAVGIPMSDRDQLFLEVHAASLPATVPTLSVNVTTFDPATGQSSTTTPVRFLVTANDYSLETASTAPTGTFSNGEVLTSVTVTSSSTVPTVGRCHVSVFLFRRGILYAQLIGDFVTNENIPTWIAGQPSHDFKNAFYDVNREACLFVLIASQANDGANSGDQIYAATPGAGSRFRVLYGRVTNNDTAARVAAVRIDDAATGSGNILHTLGFNSALGAANTLPFPSTATTDASSFAPNGAGGRYLIADGDSLIMRVNAVAVSQDSQVVVVLEVWGAAPTITLTGPTGSTPTTTTAAFRRG